MKSTEDKLDWKESTHCRNRKKKLYKISRLAAFITVRDKDIDSRSIKLIVLIVIKEEDRPFLTSLAQT